MESRAERGRNFQCSVCRQNYTCPRSLPCFHTFCENCIISAWSEFDKEKNLRRSAKCPVCDDDILAPNSNISLKDWVRSFPRNDLLETLLNAKNGCTRCVPCSRAAEDKDAVYHCQDCRESLCETCYSYMHQRIEGFQKHTVSKNPITENLDMNDKCVIHPNEILEKYCASHQLLCCKICLATEHKTCSEVQPIDVVQTKSTDASSNNTDVILELQSVTKKVDSALASTVKDVDGLEKKHSALRNTASSATGKILSKIQEMHNVFNSKLQETQEKERKYLSSSRIHLEAFLNTLSVAENLLTAVCECGTPRQLFVTASKVKFQIQKHLERLEKLHGKQLEITCEINKDVDAFCDIEYIAKLNEIDVDQTNIVEIEDQMKSFEGSMRVDDALLLGSKTDPAKLAAKEIAKYAEEMPDMRDGCLLSDGTVLVISYGEFRMLRDGEEMRTLIELESDERPYVFERICSDERDRIFIKSSQGIIMEYAIHDDQLQHIRDISFDVAYGAFRYFANKFYCLSCPYKKGSGLLIFNENGKLLRVIEGTTERGSELALSSDGQCIYYSNRQEIFCRDLTGKPPYYKHSKSEDPYSYRIYHGIDVDRYGNVYAFQEGENCIVQISENGQECRDFLEVDSNFRPESIRFDHARARFAVFCNNNVYREYTQVVKVYELIVDENESEECVADDEKEECVADDEKVECVADDDD